FPGWPLSELELFDWYAIFSWCSEVLAAHVRDKFGREPHVVLLDVVCEVARPCPDTIGEDVWAADAIAGGKDVFDERGCGDKEHSVPQITENAILSRLRCVSDERSQFRPVGLSVAQLAEESGPQMPRECFDSGTSHPSWRLDPNLPPGLPLRNPVFLKTGLAAVAPC